MKTSRRFAGASTALFVACVPLPAGDVERAEELLFQYNWVEMELLEGSEALTLLGRPAVRVGLRKRVRELFQDEEDGAARAGHLFKALAAADAAAGEDLQILADIAQRQPDNVDSLARFLLERAPFSLSPAIEKSLLAPLTRHAA